MGYTVGSSPQPQLCPALLPALGTSFTSSGTGLAILLPLGPGLGWEEGPWEPRGLPAEDGSGTMTSHSQSNSFIFMCVCFSLYLFIDLALPSLGTSLVAQTVKNLLAMQETRI